MLFLVGTPIGNLEDFTFRAVRVLQSCERILCEDTRHSRKLLNHYQIHKPLVSFHAHNLRERLPELVTALAAGEHLALITDAGMPAISDPGAELVAACREANIPIEVIPGPSAVTAAVALAGLFEGRFVFEGFLPASGRERRERLAALTGEPRAVVLFEGPHRLERTLADLAEQLGADRSVVLCRELTKLHEQVWQGSLGEAIAHFHTTTPRGEFTLVLPPAPPSESAPVDEQSLRAALAELLAAGLSRSEASRRLAERTGLSRKYLYQFSLSSESEA